jgi:hypothetical protein
MEVGYTTLGAKIKPTRIVRKNSGRSAFSEIK